MFSGNGLEQGDAQAVDIALGRWVLAAYLLRRNVLQRTDLCGFIFLIENRRCTLLSQRFICGAQVCGDAEITQVGIALIV